VGTVTLTEQELGDAVQAARLAARQAQKDATAQPNPPRINATFAADAERYAALSEKFERLRREPPKLAR
jgi:sugar (pentulose or hexulose) kinase